MRESLPRLRATVVSAALALGLAGCALEVGGFVNEKSAVARVATSEAVVVATNDKAVNSGVNFMR